jgi:hypothetical protein
MRSREGGGYRDQATYILMIGQLRERAREIDELKAQF